MEKFEIQVEGRNYQVEDFSKIYLQGMVECLAKNRISNVAFLNNSAQVVKKIAVPTIPDNLISESNLDNELYLWNCDTQLIPEILLKIAMAWFVRNIPKSKAAEAELYKQQQKTCEDALNKLLENQDQDTIVVDTSKDEEIRQLKAQLARVEERHG